MAGEEALPVTVLAVPCGEHHLPAGLSTHYDRPSQTDGVELKIIVIELCLALTSVAEDFTISLPYFFLTTALYIR